MDSILFGFLTQFALLRVEHSWWLTADSIFHTIVCRRFLDRGSHCTSCPIGQLKLHQHWQEAESLPRVAAPFGEVAPLTTTIFFLNGVGMRCWNLHELKTAEQRQRENQSEARSVWITTRSTTSSMARACRSICLRRRWKTLNAVHAALQPLIHGGKPRQGQPEFHLVFLDLLEPLCTLLHHLLHPL